MRLEQVIDFWVLQSKSSVIAKPNSVIVDDLHSGGPLGLDCSRLKGEAEILSGGFAVGCGKAWESVLH